MIELLTDIQGAFYSIPNIFWIEFLSALLVGIIFSLAIPLWLNFLKRPQLKLFFPETDSDKYQIRKLSSGDYEDELTFLIVNEGQSAFNRYYCTIYMSAHLSPSLEQKKGDSEIDIISKNGIAKISVLIKEPIYPQRHTYLPGSLRIKLSKANRNLTAGNEIGIYYFFSTELGTSPLSAIKTLKFPNRSPDLDKLGSLKIVLPD
jgi:hypothetical protein